MSRAGRFNQSRNMAEAQMEQFQQELRVLAERLSEREQQLAQVTQQGQNQVEQLQAQLNEVLIRLDEREQEIALLQIQQVPEPAPEPAPVPILETDFSRGRVPDIIKGLPQYSGSPHQLSTWTQSVDRILRHFSSLRTTEIYQLWLQEIRNKIVGEAGDMLASNGIPLDWNAIKSQLILLYGDKRELSTLLQKLFSLRQGRLHVNDFYTSIRDCFTGISTHIQTSQEWEKPAELVKFVDKLCLEKFVDGLEEPFATHVDLMQPTTLNQAFQYAIDKANKIARKVGEYDVGKSHPKPLIPPKNISPPNNFRQIPQANKQFHPPPLQAAIQNRQPPHYNYRPYSHPANLRPLNNFQQPFPQPRQSNFQSNRAPYPQQNNQQYPQRPANFQNNSLPYRPPQQNPPRPRPEPMEVDHSIRSRNVNYMNRPHYQVQEEFNGEYAEYYPEYSEYSEQPSYDDLNTEEVPEQQAEANEQHVSQEDDLNFHLGIGTPNVT